jgi:hypothetical protein
MQEDKHPADERMQKWLGGEPFNTPDRMETVAIGGEIFNRVRVDRPAGGKCVDLPTTEEIVRFRADPDAFAGEHFGLTKDQYREWVAFDGTALCGERTKSGDLCGNAVSIEQMAADHWKVHHRQRVCESHGGPPPAASTWSLPPLEKRKLRDRWLELATRQEAIDVELVAMWFAIPGFHPEAELLGPITIDERKMRELITTFGIPRSDISRGLDRLVSLGFLSRSGDVYAPTMPDWPSEIPGGAL